MLELLITCSPLSATSLKSPSFFWPHRRLICKPLWHKQETLLSQLQGIHFLPSYVGKGGKNQCKSWKTTNGGIVRRRIDAMQLTLLHRRGLWGPATTAGWGDGRLLRLPLRIASKTDGVVFSDEKCVFLFIPCLSAHRSNCIPRLLSWSYLHMKVSWGCFFF